MRRLMVGALALGCLGLLVGTLAVSMPRPVHAQSGGDISYAACLAAEDGGYDACRQGGFVQYCHFNEGGDGAGRAHCGNESSYAAHVGPGIVVGHSQKDFCITSAEELDLCLAGKTPDPK